MAQNFKGTIPQKYNLSDIQRLDQNTLNSFSTTLNSPRSLSHRELIRVLSYLGALQRDEHIFAVFNDTEGQVKLYTFDLNSTPYGREIVNLHERLRSSPDQKDKSLDLMTALINLTVDYIEFGLDEDEEFTQGALEFVSDQLGYNVDRMDLGEWNKVNSPYRKIHVGLYQ